MTSLAAICEFCVFIEHLELLNPTFGSRDLLQKVGHILPDRTIKAQGPEEGGCFPHRTMEAHQPAWMLESGKVMHISSHTLVIPRHLRSLAVA